MEIYFLCTFSVDPDDDIHREAWSEALHCCRTALKYEIGQLFFCFLELKTLLNL